MDNLRLKPDQLTNKCASESFEFKTTEELSPIRGIIGQDRAKNALEFGLGVTRKGYNIYVSGQWGTGRNSFVNMLTEEQAIKRSAPSDWLYVNNFKDPYHPIAIKVTNGQGKNIIKQVDRSIRFLRRGIIEIFSSRDYENAKQKLVEEYNIQSNSIVDKLNELGKKYGFLFSLTEKGIVSIPLKDGKPMNEEDYHSISQKEYEVLMSNSQKLSLETIDLFNKLRIEEENLRNKLKSLDEQMVRHLVKFHLESIKDKNKDNEDIKHYIDSIEDDIVENLEAFKEVEEDDDENNPLALFAASQHNPETFFERYRINLFVDNSEAKRAPVIFESNPTYYNMAGSIEYQNEMGVMKTDFTMIKPGALHRANGGYLILLAKDILSNPYSWKSLKRSLLDESVTIDSRAASAGALVSQTIRPQAIPIDVKVIIIGDYYTYSILNAYDEEFQKLFKVMVDFDVEMDRNKENIEKFARFVSTKCQMEGLSHFTPDAVALLVEHATRLSDDQNKLTAHLKTLGDIIIEADAWANYYKEGTVTHEHVQKALEERKLRANKYEENTMDLYKEGVYLIDVNGFKIGEINGLAVVGSGQYSFGKPSKITVSTYQGRQGIINIEREARTSGKIHDKGVMILTGYLGKMFAQDKPLALTASIVFEQLYSGVDGDSASSTELYALISDLSGVPINQAIAVTGSVNQRGYIQPIGGVNEKIEGYYKVCKIKGLNNEQGVIIPIQNVKNLMLDDEIVNAVRNKTFHIWAISHVDEGIEILTGRKPGKRTKDGNFEKGTVYAMVDQRLQHLAKESKTKTKETPVTEKTTRASQKKVSKSSEE
ncbi:ATP-binding protein [Fusibacter bizertensis]|jgi:Predicted ATP-dependent protease|uniref:endopeptidase La n=1 Tax=Fusibacter bizertensis TaxID=1488331 RepID=A0ABT6NBA3_9FIRM|nr:ATP-binding protein [Fusibacter bizertensis]MDH8677691.1 ATP-binding protein [Fusibacter bizertensis]